MTVFWETMSPVSWEKQRRQMQKHGFGTPASFPFLVIDFSGFQLLLTLECWELTHAFKTNSHFLFKPASVSFCYLQPKSANEHGICCCLVTKLCLTLCDPMDCSSPGFSVHRICQTRILEWVALPSYRRSSWPRDRTHIFCVGRQILYHWATSEAWRLVLLINLYLAFFPSLSSQAFKWVISMTGTMLRSQATLRIPHWLYPNVKSAHYPQANLGALPRLLGAFTSLLSTAQLPSWLL